MTPLPVWDAKMFASSSDVSLLARAVMMGQEANQRQLDEIKARLQITSGGNASSHALGHILEGCSPRDMNEGRVLLDMKAVMDSNLPPEKSMSMLRGLAEGRLGTLIVARDNGWAVAKHYEGGESTSVFVDSKRHKKALKAAGVTKANVSRQEKPNFSKALSTQISELKRELEGLKAAPGHTNQHNKPTNPFENTICHECGFKGHIKTNCPSLNPRKRGY